MRAFGQRVQEGMRLDSPLFRWSPLLLVVGTVSAMTLAMQVWPGAFQLESLLLGYILSIAFTVFIAIHSRRSLVPADDGSFIGRTEMRFAPEGISTIRARSRSHCSWTQVRDISYTPAHIFLWVDHLTAHTIRVADLPAPMTVEQAVARFHAFKAAAGAAAPVASNGDENVAPVALAALAAVAVSPPASPSLWQELKAVFRLGTFRSVDSARLFGRDSTLFLLGALSLALWIGLDRLDYGPDAEFMWFGLSDLATGVCFALVIAWVLSRLSSPRLPLRRTLLLVALAAPLLVLSGWLMEHMRPTMYYLALFVITAWLARLVYLGLLTMTGRRQWRALAAGATSFLVLVYFSAWVFPGGTDLWYVPEAEYDPTSAESAQREQLQFEQAPRIDAALAKLPAGDPAHAAMYFVGFAGYGEQRVFAEEIGTAARVVGEKFSLGGRELRLVNDQRDETTWPAASGSALRHALLGVGQRMNRDNDVLFLALSSHGSEDASLSVMNDSLSLWRDLDATELRTMLQESGIRWRVIVISACHAGSFIDSLADENTIVLTAAAKENTSFGCSDDRDLTYFGEAFYRDALPKAASLREAFEQARVAIAAREKNEGVDESDPQAHFGAALEAKLAQMTGTAMASAQGR